jgi:MEMO1 family protein
MRRSWNGSVLLVRKGRTTPVTLTTERPRLRSHLRRATAPRDTDHVYLDDQLGLCAAPERLTPQEASWLTLLDGERTLADIHRAAGGAPLERIAGWLERLDRGLLLDSPRFRAVVDGPVRPARHAGGCYAADPDGLRGQLDGYFTQPGGPGLPRSGQSDGGLRVALLPHVDYRWGGLSYAWGFKEIVERTDAALFVIVATSHYSQHRFTLTRKHFDTPLGVVPTDADFVDRLAGHYGDGLFDDEWLAHLPEHSVELEAIFLRHLYAGRRDLRIVPLVVGSFHDSVLAGQEPHRYSDVARMIDALRRTAAATREPVCFLISGDLAHIGPKFNPNERLTQPLLHRSFGLDHDLLRRAADGDSAGYFQRIAGECDARNICGFPPTFLVLGALHPRAGRLLHYDRYVDPQGFASVSWASMTFEGCAP